MSVTVVRWIVLETCEVIWKYLSGIYLSLPDTYEWERIAEDFNNMWDFPKCVGAFDGNNVAITSNYYTYNGTYSIVLMGVCDENQTFIASIWCLWPSQFGRLLQSENFNLPADTTLPNSDVKFPYYLVGEAAFPLKPYLMRPYPELLLREEKKNFNKILSRSRRIE